MVVSLLSTFAQGLHSRGGGHSSPVQDLQNEGQQSSRRCQLSVVLLLSKNKSENPVKGQLVYHNS